VVHPRFVPVVDSAALPLASRPLAEQLREAACIWVVAAAAPYGEAARRSGRPYNAWIGTSLEQEWTARRQGLSRARRTALTANAPLLRRLERRVLEHASRVYATSPSSRAALADAADLDPRTIGVLPIPVDLELFSPLADEDWIGGLERPIVAFVGRADDPRKNVALLLSAWPLVRARVPEARLRLVGRPPSVALPAGVDALGEVPSVAAELAGASLFVLPSLQEGFGIVVAEALACGVPALVTPCGGPEDLIRSSGSGAVLPDFEPETMADAIVAALGDGDRLSEQRTHGRAYVEAEHSPVSLRERLRRELDA
jgi:phosphatidylinositol alpha-mannosyltransferase